ncbi:aKG-HExxH-type peptide beta-hydroxylase [Motilimonas eburnea]|uniref:aKG-HExxH-type peptide beta-hydroxylase n=1 Tax=Motilimonas eburnea TaxID=1737488 RepID=UPI001E5ECA2C|nr:HEXXH motif-containing putative peptide modification protein [Motilimonas eburnea]MCE2571811.1 hypothetical protein [Motilimonas eburnea]
MEIFTSIPNPKANKSTARKLREFQVDLWKIYTSMCETKLGLELSDINEILDSIVNEKKLSPKFIFAFYELSCSMKSGDITGILDSLSKIKIAIGNEIISEKIEISSICSEDWEWNYINYLRSYERKNIRNESTIVRPILNNSELDFHKKNIEVALNLIKEQTPCIYSEVEAYLTDIKIFQGRVLRGDTSSKVFGAIWLRVPEKEDDQVAYWIEHIIHEVSHLKLEALFHLDKLTLNCDDEKIFRAPIRNEMRPLRGVFHATFVLSRMVRFFKTASLNGYDKRFRDRLQLCRLQLEIGINEVLSDKANFTENGKKIRDSFNECSML